MTLFPHVYQKLNYAPLKDFIPVTTVCTFPFLLAVGPMVPGNETTLAQFIEWCRINPKLATYGSPGAGTRPHFLGVALARAAGFEFVHLPYRGGALAMQDLLGGPDSSYAQRIRHRVPAGNIRQLASARYYGPATKPIAAGCPHSEGSGIRSDGGY